MTTGIGSKTITATELAGRLGAVLDEVEAGLTFTVKRHGRPVAILGAIPGSTSNAGGATLACEARQEYRATAMATVPALPDTALARLVGGPSTRAVLSIFLREPATALHQREVARRAGIGLRSAQIALGRLVEAGLLSSVRDGNRLYYRAQRTQRFEDLSALMSREFGVTEVIARHLGRLGKPIPWAFVFGSAASGADTLGSDIDLCVVAEVSDDELVAPIAEIQRELAREVDLVSYQPSEFAQKRAQGNHFIRQLLKQERIDVMGSGDGL